MAGEFIALAATLSFVISNIIFRKAEHDCSPVVINTFRTMVGTITFVGIAAISGILPIIFQLSWQLNALIILSFVFGQVLGDTSYFYAQSKLGATKAMAISLTYPLFSFVLSMIFLGEPFEWTVLVSFVFISTGVMVIAKVQQEHTAEYAPSAKGNTIPTSDASVMDVLEPKSQETGLVEPSSVHFSTEEKKIDFTYTAVGAALIASLGWAAGLVIIEYATNEIDALYGLGAQSSILGNALRFPVASLMLLGILYGTEKKPVRRISRGSWIWLVLGALIGTSLGAYLYTEAARVANSVTMSLMASANPLFSVVLSYLINREKISLKSFFGILSIIIGVVFIFIF